MDETIEIQIGMGFAPIEFDSFWETMLKKGLEITEHIHKVQEVKRSNSNVEISARCMSMTDSGIRLRSIQN